MFWILIVGTIALSIFCILLYNFNGLWSDAAEILALATHCLAFCAYIVWFIAGWGYWEATVQVDIINDELGTSYSAYEVWLAEDVIYRMYLVRQAEEKDNE